jgi:hypothetical protein
LLPKPHILLKDGFNHDSGWRQFTAHAKSLGLEPLGAHPALVVTFLGNLRDGGASTQTLSSRAAAIRFFHHAAGLASPTDQRVVRDLLEGARRADAGPAIMGARPSPPNASLQRSRSKGRQRRRSQSAIARSCC